MASLQIEVASSSSPFTYSRRDHHTHSKNITGYMTQCIRKNKAHDDDEDSSWLPSHNSKTDDSWLPVHVTSKSNASNHRKGQTDVDDSWLPANNDTKGKGWKNTSQPHKDIDYSWLPSTYIDNKDKKHKHDKIKDKSKNNAHTNTTKNNNSKNNINISTNSNSVTSQKISTNNHWALAREVVFSSDEQDAPSISRSTVESPSSEGVSSLLRRWSAFAEEKNSNNDGNQSPASSSRSNLGSTKESKSSTHSPPSATKYSNWESENTSRSRRLSCPLPSRDIKDPEKEKSRVVDIVKKMSKEEELAASQAAGGNGNESSLPRIRTSLDNQQIEEHIKGFKSGKVSRPLIRGRQAFNDFLTITEHDKDRELKWLLGRKVVSKFSHRGRLQAVLRFKALRLESEPKPKLEAKRHRRCVSKTLDPNNRVDIMDLRERFDSGSEKGETKSRKHKSALKNTHNNEEVYGTPTAEMDGKTKTKNKSITTFKKQDQIPKPEPMTSHQSTRFQIETCKYIAQKAKEAQTLRKTRYGKDDDKLDFPEDEGQFMSAKTSYSQIEDRGLSDSEDNTVVDNSYDWISDISRPKSDWEDMRQARKKVSGFLSSSLRDLIDQVMMSRVQQSHAQEEKQQVVVTDKGVSRNKEGYEDHGDCRRRNRQYSEYSEYVDRTPDSERSWRPNDGVYSSETTTTTTATTSPSLERSPASNRSQNNITPESTPTVIHPSAEMELIYDLRGHMEQLHQEIMELRRSIKGCVSMQVKMQVSLKQNVPADVESRSVQKKEVKPPGVGKPCSICGDMQINSLLYSLDDFRGTNIRCGHMCTCFNCAVELQRTCGECPVCEAPIVDVVMAFVH
ncbi:hypothetical protein LXL04_014307 [Taraxacum kok-saghyz]